jgi:hypothetical protein
MAEYQAIPVSSVEASDITDDSRTAIIVLRLVGGELANLLVPREQLPHLIGVASAAEGHMARASGDAPAGKHIFAVDRWEVRSLAPFSEGVVLSFQLPGGMDLSFRVDRDAADRMRESLNALLGRPSPQSEPVRH